MSEYGDKMKRGTPWGTPDSCREIASGIIFYSTPSHGGFWLSTERRNEIHPVLRKQDGWYEEDAEWSKVVLGFSRYFSEEEKEKALSTLKNYFPDCYEKWSGKKLLPGESLFRDEKTFLMNHKHDWLVHSAFTSEEYPGFVRVYASLGGERTTEKQFLVPSDEYGNRTFQFVIDLARHKEVTRELENSPGM